MNQLPHRLMCVRSRVVEVHLQELALSEVSEDAQLLLVVVATDEHTSVVRLEVVTQPDEPEARLSLHPVAQKHERRRVLRLLHAVGHVLEVGVRAAEPARARSKYRSIELVCRARGVERRMYVTVAALTYLDPLVHEPRQILLEHAVHGEHLRQLLVSTVRLEHVSSRADLPLGVRLRRLRAHYLAEKTACYESIRQLLRAVQVEILAGAQSSPDLLGQHPVHALVVLDVALQLREPYLDSAALHVELDRHQRYLAAIRLLHAAVEHVLPELLEQQLGALRVSHGI